MSMRLNMAIVSHVALKAWVADVSAAKKSVQCSLWVSSSRQNPIMSSSMPWSRKYWQSISWL
nr:hypothetical protein [Candidatus Sigynarchaeum springense]